MRGDEHAQREDADDDEQLRDGHRDEHRELAADRAQPCTAAGDGGGRQDGRARQRQQQRGGDQRGVRAVDRPHGARGDERDHDRADQGGQVPARHGRKR